MKKLPYNILIAGLTSVLIAHGQTNAPAPVDNTNAVAASQPATTTTPAADNSSATNTAPTTDTSSATNTTPAASATPTADAASATNSPAAQTDSNTAAAAVTNTGAPPTTASSPSTVGTNNTIPLIQFSDVPLTTAIENLARQAGINYMMDPKIGYGQPDASGQIKPEPVLSIRWQNITAESALRALLDNYGLQLVVDRKTGIDRITMKDPLALPPLATRVIQLQYAGVSNMAPAVESVLTDKRSKVIADVRTSQLLVVATDPEQQSVDTLVAQLDKPTKQVLIETKLVEVSSTPSATRGVDWTGTLQQQHVTFGNGNVSGTTTTTQNTPPGTKGVITSLTQMLGTAGWAASTAKGLVPATAFLNADGVSAVLSFLNASYDAQVFSTPRVVTLDNETAHIEVIRTFPIIQLSGGTANASGAASVTYSNIGTILSVTPRISANDNIWLDVIPEVSSHFGDETVTQNGGLNSVSTTFSVPIFDRRKIESKVMIPDGNTLVMGGLVQDNPTATYSQVPFLGSIPGLGWAFHSESKSMTKDNLIIFMTPTIVKDEDFQPNTTTFLQSKARTMRQPMDPHKPWDTAEPIQGWNNPAPTPGEFSGPPPQQ